MQPLLGSIAPVPGMVELPELDELETLALVSKWVAGQAGVPQPISSQDGYLFLGDLIDSKGCLTDAGIVCARLLQDTGNYSHVTAPMPSRPQWAAEKQTIHTVSGRRQSPVRQREPVPASSAWQAAYRAACGEILV